MTTMTMTMTDLPPQERLLDKSLPVPRGTMAVGGFPEHHHTYDDYDCDYHYEDYHDYHHTNDDYDCEYDDYLDVGDGKETFLIIGLMVVIIAKLMTVIVIKVGVKM